MKWRASLVEIYRRFTPVNKDDNKEIYWNGDDNMYPSEIEGVICNSPTAFRAATLFAKFIGGSGVSKGDGVNIAYKDLPVINPVKGYKITDIVRMAANDIAIQYGVWFHVGYGIGEDGKIKQNSIDVLPYPKCRKAKDDDDQRSGKIYFKDYSAKSKFGGKKKDPKWFYPYNPDPKVVIEQIKADAGKVEDLEEALKKYRGQVYYLNLTPQYVYALSRFDPVYNDADTEYRVGLYTNNETRSGFLGKTIVVLNGLDETQAIEEEKTIAKWLGAENSGNVHVINSERTEDLSQVIHIQQVKAQYDEKLFSETDKRIRRNILGAANNIPEAMVNASDGALFGTQSDTYREMKLFYSEQTAEEREKLQETLSYLGFPITIEPIVKVDAAVTSDKQADAQAALKGSVGGVTALIQLQTAVSQGFASRDAAVQIIETIYGIDRLTAEKMIGNPIEAPITEEGNDLQQQ